MGTRRVYPSGTHRVSTRSRPPGDRIGSMSPKAPRILLVDDEPDLLRVSEKLLRSFAFEVVSTTSPREALRHAAASGPFVALVSDVNMPSLAGPQLFLELERIGLAMPVLYVSGGARLEPLPQGQRWLEKPFSREQLAAELRALGLI